MAIATENRVRFSRVWEMPNKNTYSIKAVERIIAKYHDEKYYSIDPFANTSKIATVTNDIDPDCKADYSMDAGKFLRMFEKDISDLVFFDPPYSPRQVSECYKKMGISVNMETTQASFWTKLKHQIAHIVKPGGIVISFGWNTNGMGQKLGFEILEILLVAHGGAHNDTIVTVERKIQSKLF